MVEKLSAQFRVGWVLDHQALESSLAIIHPSFVTRDLFTDLGTGEVAG